MNSVFKYSFLIVAALVLLTSAVSAEDSTSPAVETAAVPANADVAVPAPEDLSIYGEVQAVDAGAQTVTLQYYDYDTDEEKTTVIVCDSLTKFENASSAADMKKGDWADVTYISKNGSNLAKIIVVEKEEEAGVPQAPTVETPGVPNPSIDQE